LIGESSNWPTRRSAALSRRVGIALLVVAAAVGGWLAGSAGGASSRLAVVAELSGRVSVASESGAKVCISPAEGGVDRCGVFYRRGDDRPVVVGDSISVAIAELRTGAAETTEIFIVEQPAD
jgi:hypothetical protein